MRFQRWFRGRGPSHYFGKPGDCSTCGIRTTSWCPACSFNGPPGIRPGRRTVTTAKHRWSPLFVRMDDQAVIPVTETTSRYFYAAGGRAKDASPDLAGDIFRFTEVAFHEDKVIIEAQQKVISLDPTRPMLSLSMDGGTEFVSWHRAKSDRRRSRGDDGYGAGRMTHGMNEPECRGGPVAALSNPRRPDIPCLHWSDQYR